MSASPSPSPPSGSFADPLLCPICFLMFNGRILQCTNGHSVCEKCHGKLKNECPQCRSHFVGTRNYILEEVVKQLQILKYPKKNGSGNEKGTNNATDAKLTNAIAKLVALIPDPSSNDNNKEEEAATESQVASEHGDTESIFSRLIIPIRQPLVAQPKGHFDCRMLNCTERLPICRLLNHFRCFHSGNLMECRLPFEEDDFVMHWTFPCASYRHAIHISQFGLFFFTVNVKKETNKTVITAWIQVVGRNTEHKKFIYSLEMRLGNLIASYADLTHNASSTIDYIETKKSCLSAETNQLAKFIKTIAVDVKIIRSTMLQSMQLRRNTNTTIVNISTAANSRPNAQRNHIHIF